MTDLFRVLVDRTTRACMRDCVELGMVIARPNAPGRFPAIMAYNPYRTLTAVTDEYSDPSYNHRWDGPKWFAERGYCVVYFDVRGTGNSGGSTQSIYAPEERRDAFEMVEWLAQQPWCDGNVGMWGMSYGGVVQWQVGVQNPPHLKTLIVGSSNDTVYGDWVYPGGSLRPYMFDTFSPLMVANNFAPPDPEVVGDRWAEMWQERLEHNVPWGIDWIKHALDDDFYTSQSLQPDYSRIKVPTMLWSGWADCYPTPILRAFSRLSVPKRAFIGPWDHEWPEMAVPGPRIEFRHEMLKWFDRWLKGIDNGVTQEPPLNLYVRGWTRPRELTHMLDSGRWQAETEWPPARMKPTPFYLGDDMRLAAKPESDAKQSYEYDPTVGVTAGIYWGGGVIPYAMPLDQRADELKSLTFTTPPFERDTELTGEPEVVLHLSSTATSGYLHTKISDVAPDGTSKWLTDGGMLISHRSSHTSPEPIVPGQVYELTIRLKFVAYLVQAAHALRLSVSSADFQNAWPAGSPAVHTIHRGAVYPSRVVLPLAPADAPKLPAPEFHPSPRPEPKDSDFAGRSHRITHDLVHDSMTVELTVVGGLIPNIPAAAGAPFGDSTSRREARSWYTVSRKNPAVASLRAQQIYTIGRPEGEVRIEANESLASDAQTFRFQSRVEIQVDGKPHFCKSWRASRPRLLD